MTKMRLQVALSRAGVASRRKSAQLIRDGKVKVNGRPVTEPGFRVDPAKDMIACGKRRCLPDDRVYIMLHKPKGVITTLKDTHGRKTVLDLIPDVACRLYHVGRLDKDSAGLLLLTNDGEVAHRLAHPRFEIERVYDVVVRGRVTEAEKEKLENGIALEGRRTSPCEIRISDKKIGRTKLRVILREGRKRQIRNMFEAIGHPVIRLKRTAFGPLHLRGLDAGEHRNLTPREIEGLKRSVGIKV